MKRSILTLALVAGTLLAATAARAGRVDVPLRPGEPADGEITTPGAVSTCAFLVTAGDTRKLRVSVKRARRSRLEPNVTLIAPDGEAIDVVAAGCKQKTKASGIKIKLGDVPQSGLWRLEVRGARDTTGAFTVTVKAKEKLSQKANIVLTVGGEKLVPVTVGDGQSLTVTVKRAKKSKFIPGIEIFDPSGEVLQNAVGRAALNAKKGTAKLSKLELPSFGTYTVRIHAREASGGGAKYVIKTSPTKFSGKRPAARPGAAFAADPSMPAALDGSASTAARGGRLGFIWTQVSGPAVTLSDRYGERPSFTAPREDSALAFELTASENAVFSTPRLIVVEIAARPIADAGRARVIAPGTSVTLDATGSIARGGGGLSATWRILDGPGTLSAADTATPRFGAPNTNGVTRLGLTVDDGRSRSTEAELIIVTTTASATVADAGREQYVGRVATVFLSGLASRRAGDALDDGARWVQLSGPPIELAGADTFHPSFTSPRTGTDLLFELTVDGDDATAHRTWVRVRPSVENTAPTTDAGNHGVVANASAFLNASASSDADGADPRDRWATVRGAGAVIGDPDGESTTATELRDASGLWLFATQSRDDLQYGPPDLKRVTGTAYEGAPLVDAGPNQTANATGFVTLRGSATQSPGGGALSYGWRQISGKDWFDAAAESASFDASTPRPRFRLRTGISSLTTTRALTFELTAQDTFGTSAPDLVTVTFTGIAPNGLPMARADASTTNPVAGSQVSLSATGNDPDGDPITFLWSQVSGPTVTLDGGAGALAPSFTAPDAGTLAFDLVANDGIDDGPPSRVTITVDERPSAVVTVSPPSGGAGQVVVFDATGSSDPEGEDLTYSWTQITGTSVSFPSTASSFNVTAPNGAIALRLVVNYGRQNSLPVTAIYSDNAPPGLAPDAQIAGTTITSAAYGTTITLRANPSDSNPVTFTWRQIGISATSPAVTLSSTSAQNPTFLVPSPTTGGRFGGQPVVTFGVTATRDGVTSSELLVPITIYASFNDTTLPAGAPRVWNVISSNCSSCHSGSSSFCPGGSGTNATGFGMGNPTAFINNAVNVASCSNVKPRIATGSTSAATSSFLVDRLNGQGGFMPPGSGGIALASRFLIMDWIDQGAVSTR